MRFLLLLLVVFLAGCSGNDASYYEQAAGFSAADSSSVKLQEPVITDSKVLVIPGNIVWGGAKSRPAKVVVEVTFTSDSTFTYKITSTGK